MELAAKIPEIYQLGWNCLIPVIAVIIGIATGLRRKKK